MCSSGRMGAVSHSPQGCHLVTSRILDFARRDKPRLPCFEPRRPDSKIESGHLVRSSHRHEKEPMRCTKAGVEPPGKFALLHSKGLDAARLEVPMGAFRHDPARHPILSNVSVVSVDRAEHDPLSKVNRLGPCVLKIDEQCI